MQRFLIFLLFLPSLAFAAISPADADYLIQHSSINDQLESLREELESGISEAKKNRRNVSDKKWKQLENMVRESFAQERLLPMIKANIEQMMTAQSFAKAKKWNNSPLGNKVRELEAEANKAVHAEQKKTALQTMKPDSLRMQRVTQLDEQLDASMSLVDLSINLQTAIIALSTSTQPADMRPDLDMIKATLDMNRFEFQIETKSRVLSSFIFTYKDLSDEEMMHFMNFVKSPEGNLYQRTLMDSVVKAVRSATDELTQKLSTL